MNTTEISRILSIEILPEQFNEGFAAVIAPQAGRSFMLDLAARLALRGRLRVLDGGNQFNAYPVARAIRRYTADLNNVLQGIRMARGFTCYQMVSLITGSPEDKTPTLVLDLLATFYDENVTLAESKRLLLSCLNHLQKLGKASPVIVGAQLPGSQVQDRLILAELVRKYAGYVWEISQQSLNQGNEPTLYSAMSFPWLELEKNCENK